MKKIICMLLVALLTNCSNPNLANIPPVNNQTKIVSIEKQNNEKNDNSRVDIIENKTVITNKETIINNQVSDKKTNNVQVIDNTTLSTKIEQTNLQSSPIPTPSVQPTKRPLTSEDEIALKYGIDFRDAPDGKYSGYGSSVRANIPYKIIKPVKEGIYSGQIELIFEDSYKIRQKNNSLEFTSLTNIDVSEVNNLINEYNVSRILGSLSSTEEEAERDYNMLLKSDPTGHAFNVLSYYRLTVNEINVKEFIDKLRTISYVREANFDYTLGAVSG